jgi:hypothetical protein
VHALYGFTRFADEIVDRTESQPPAERAAELSAWSTGFVAGLRGEPVDDPLLPAVLHTIAVFGLDLEDFEKFLRSMEMDLTVTGYPTYEDLLEYMEGSAAVIGTMMLPILGSSDPVAAREPARQLGFAFQLTNFIRDVAEDLARGRVYLPEEGIALRDLSRDVERMVDSFRVGQRLFLTVMNEKASAMYTSDFLCRLFEQESQGLFDARAVVLGQIQQGGTPSPFDRILGTRLAAHAMDWISNEIDRKRADNAVIGYLKGSVKVMSMRQAEDLADWENRRPQNEWWMRLRPILDVLAQRVPAEQGAPAN